MIENEEKEYQQLTVRIASFARRNTSVIVSFGVVRNWFSTASEVKSLYIESLAAFEIVTKLEDISPSLEPSHAFAEAIKLAPKLTSSTVIVVNSCGDSLKDKFIIQKRRI